ncbi:MAG: sodium-translocating pyrophosphatase [Phycisphaerales bacterium]|nr:sodium-translocating pyrophosphatase [Phycisphaerales bacterium]
MSMQLMPTLASMSEVTPAYYLAPIGGILALIMAKMFHGSVMKKSEGDENMVEIAQAVRDGAMAYLGRQYKVVAGVFVLLIIFLGIMYALKLQEMWTLIGVPVAGLFSGLCGWFGMRMATNASARTAWAAKQSLNEGLTVAFRSGAVMGLVVVGFALIDISAWFFIFNSTGLIEGGISEITVVMLSFGMGASTQALFARVGGGIYTKAADVGADLVGKVEAGIPEDDARNPATIADNVGDNVGDVAGMGADLYESYYGSILATMALGAAAAMTLASGDAAGALGIKLAVTPMALAGLGIFCSIIGVFTVKAKENASFAQLLKGLHKGVYVASALIIVGAFGLLWFILNDASELGGITTWWRLGLSIVSGLIAGLVIAHATEYYTSYEHKPTQRIAEQALTGPATVIIAGIAEGMKSTWASLLTVVVAIILSFSFAGGGDSFLMGLYGVGIAAVGMLSTLGITLATDAYGPIADNAGGNAEMTGQPPMVRERTDMLDSLGNTTAATGKGFAIGSAALTAMALFAAYIQIVQTQITSQAENYFGDGAAFVAPAEADNGFAVYSGYGRFAISTNEVDEEGDVNIDGGMTIDVTTADGKHTNRIKDLSKGDIFPIVSIHDSRYEIAGEGWTATLASSERGSVSDVLTFYDVTLANPKLLGGLFIGVLLAFLFCALTMNAVGRAAYAMMGECRRQFGFIREALRRDGMSEEDLANPDNWPMKGVDLDGHHYPDYANCVAISTAGAQKEMVVPSVLAIVIPIVVGLTLSVPGVMGLLAGGLTSGFAVAVFMANAGGAWDNAKKLLESYGKTTADEMVAGTGNSTKIPAAVRDAIMARAQEAVAAGRGDEIVYGKGSDDHKATVVGDTVGDPFKDTSGPALNILIKLISIVSVVFAGLIVAYGDILGGILGF